MVCISYKHLIFFCLKLDLFGEHGLEDCPVAESLNLHLYLWVLSADTGAFFQNKKKFSHKPSPYQQLHMFEFFNIECPLYKFLC